MKNRMTMREWREGSRWKHISLGDGWKELNCEYVDIKKKSNWQNFMSYIQWPHLSVFTSPDSSVITIPSGSRRNLPAQRQSTNSNVYIFTVKKCWDSPNWCWIHWHEAAQYIVGIKVISPESWIEPTARRSWHSNPVTCPLNRCQSVQDN